MDKYPLFSNGTEFDFWTSRNCEKCAKGVFYNEKKDYFPKWRCAIQREIDEACITDGMGSKRAYEATHDSRCPYWKDKKQRVQDKKHRNIHGQQELPFEELKGGEE